MTTIQAPQCVECKHFLQPGWRCAAYPQGIPEPILDGEHDHRKPFFGDNGIRFEPVEESDVSANPPAQE